MSMEVENYDQTCERLRPCPFCGTDPVWHLIGNGSTRSQRIVVKCPKCRVQRTDAILNGHGHSLEWLEDAAVRGWNRRARTLTLHTGVTRGKKELAERYACHGVNSKYGHDRMYEAFTAGWDACFGKLCELIKQNFVWNEDLMENIKEIMEE